ncbi:hypothetical protein RUM44_002873 [Polyplax serrata]|uniref:Parathion hydrolase-related protein n=1 Tax=Polyplax serrata TaxID=468196 RepID=A0ABR1AWY0_POLSC
MADTIQTVLGKVNPEDVGRTLTHEHMFLDYRKFYVSPPSGLEEHLQGNIRLENVGFVQRYPYSSMTNLEFDTTDMKASMFEEMKLYRKFGGHAIVENTSRGLGGDVGFLEEVSRKTGVHVVSGTGFYLASVQPASLLNENVERLCTIMRSDLTSGCSERSQVKCGVIGEVASHYPIHHFEEKAIKATGMVQEELKCPVTFHPGRDEKAPFEVMRFYTEAGGRANKAVMSHLDRTLKTSKLLDFASEYKCFLQHDLFGTEVLTYQLGPKFQMPSDAQRLDRIKLLIEEGFSDRILMSHDIHTKHRLAAFGGHGYYHIFLNVLPKMRTIGISDHLIDQITIKNPRNWLSWRSP